MCSSKQEIIAGIKGHIGKHGGKYFAWYVGVSRNAENKLSRQHKPHGDLYISKRAYSSYVAIEVRDYFVNTLGTDGDTDGRDDSAETVYAYRKTANPVCNSSPVEI